MATEVLHQLTPLLAGKHEAIAGSRSFAALRLPTPPHTEPIGPVEDLGFYVWEWLTHLGLFQDLVIDKIVEAYAPAARKLALNIHDGVIASTISTLTVTERRYVSWTGCPAFFDADALKPLNGLLPGHPVTMIVCNVVMLFKSKREWLKRLQGRTGAQG
jgi:hypothetical protein